MRATEDDGVDVRVGTEQLVDALLDEVVGTGRSGLASLNKWCPKRTGDAGEGDVGEKFLDFEFVALAAHGSLGGEQPDVARLRLVADDFGGGADDAEHPFG